MSHPLLSIVGLTKSYGGRQVVVGLDADVAVGEVVALCGPNGAGKTTILRCVLGLDEADAGGVIFDGSPYDERDPAIRARIAAVLDDMGWFPDLTAFEHLDVLARAHGDPDPEAVVDGALHALKIAHIADQVPLTLSSGQRRRLTLAMALVRPYELLVLDEPEQRLDVSGRAWLATYLRGVADGGAAVLMASHDDELIASVRARVVPVREFEGLDGGEDPDGEGLDGGEGA